MNKTDQRRKSIIEIVFTDEKASVKNLANIFKVSDMTIRRDLNVLEKTGQIIRTRGGAVSILNKSATTPLVIRVGEKHTIKEKIGQVAASLINDGEIIALDTGSTTLEVANSIPKNKKITAISNCLTILQALSNRPNLNLITTGGVFDQLEQTFIGGITIRIIESLNFDKFFFGVGGIEKKFGVTESNSILINLKQMFIRNSREVIAVFDSSKFGKINNIHVCPINSISSIVTNEAPKGELLNYIQDLGVKIIITD